MCLFFASQQMFTVWLFKQALYMFYEFTNMCLCSYENHLITDLLSITLSLFVWHHLSVFRYHEGLLQARTDDPDTAVLVKRATEGMIAAVDQNGAHSVLEWEVDELLEWTNSLNFEKYAFHVYFILER